MSGNPGIDADEKSDACVVPMNHPNNDAASKPASAEDGEGRRAAEGNAEQPTESRTQGRTDSLTGLQRVGEAARAAKAAGNGKMQFTAWMHHITPELLLSSFKQLKKAAAPGVDGMTWGHYEVGLHDRIGALCDAVHSGRYRAFLSQGAIAPGVHPEA